MSTEELLKNYIKEQYKSILEFTTTCGLPYSTVMNIFQRGLSGASITTVDKICTALRIRIEELIKGNIVKIEETSVQTEPEQHLLRNYRMLNEDGRTEAQKQVENLTYIPKYRLLEHSADKEEQADPGQTLSGADDLPYTHLTIKAAHTKDGYSGEALAEAGVRSPSQNL